MKNLLSHRENEPNAEVMLSSSVILEGFREEFSVKALKARQRKKGSAYSMVSHFTGGMLGVMASLRVGFKVMSSCEIIKMYKRAIYDLTGIKCSGDTFNQDPVGLHQPAYMQVTPECPDYSRGSTAFREKLNHGVDGETGWQLVMALKPISILMPLIVEIEMVANVLTVHGGKEVVFVLKALNNLYYNVHAAIVKMQSYGDMIGKERLVVVGCHESLGEHGKQHRIPLGHYSDTCGVILRS